jgi:hypothetical protein
MKKEFSYKHHRDHLGLSGEELVYVKLSTNGMKPSRNRKIGCGYDMTACGGLRIEVKTARCANPDNPRWVVNIHRHNVVRESNVDLYVVGLHGLVGTKAAVYLLFRAPIKTQTLGLSVRSILSRYAIHAQYWRDFIESKGKILPPKTCYPFSRHFHRRKRAIRLTESTKASKLRKK